MICQFSAPFFSCLLIFYLFTIAFDDDFVSCCWFFDQFAMFSGLIFQLFADCLIICRVFWPCICHVFWPDLSAVADFWKFHDPVGSSHNFLCYCLLWNWPRGSISTTWGLRFPGCFHHFSQSVFTSQILILCFRTSTFVAGFDPMALLWLGSCFDRPILYFRIPVTVSPGPI